VYGLTDHAVEAATWKESLERKRTDRDDQPRGNQCHHRVQPWCAERDLRGARTAVSGATRTAAGEAGGHGGHVDAISHLLLVAEAGADQPSHQLAPCSSREWPALIDLHRPRSLSDEQDALPGVAAEDRVRARDVTSVDAAACRRAARVAARSVAGRLRWSHAWVAIL